MSEALGLFNYFLMRRYMAHVGSDPDEQPLDWRKLGAVLAGSVVAALLLGAGGYLWVASKEARRRRVGL